MTLFCPQGPTVVEQSDRDTLASALATLRTEPLRIGLEREAWRIDAHGCPSAQLHPFAADRDGFAEGRITVDFAENQAELITAPMAGSAGALAQLRRLHARLYRAVPGELLWPLSTPGCWNGRVQPATFGGAVDQEPARQYRDYLADKYGAARQAISGVHFNVSFPESFWAALESGGDDPADRSAQYFAIMRNLLRYRFVLTYLLGASPLVDARWGAELAERLDAPGRSLFAACGRYSSSLRSGPLGYQLSDRVAADLAGVWSGLPAYAGGIRGAITRGALAGEREFYAPVRPKTSEGGTLGALQRRGVEYLEIRVLDLDPFADEGVALTTLHFLEAFVAAATLLPDRPLTAEALAAESRLNTWATMCSCPDAESVRAGLAVQAEPLWTVLHEAAELLGTEHVAAVAEFAEIFAGRKPRLVERFFAGAAEARLSLREFGLRLARQHQEALDHD